MTNPIPKPGDRVAVVWPDNPTRNVRGTVSESMHVRGWCVDGRFSDDGRIITILSKPDVPAPLTPRVGDLVRIEKVAPDDLSAVEGVIEDENGTLLIRVFAATYVLSYDTGNRKITVLHRPEPNLPETPQSVIRATTTSGDHVAHNVRLLRLTDRLSTSPRVWAGGRGDVCWFKADELSNIVIEIDAAEDDFS
jgi:hypothetical protein